MATLSQRFNTQKPSSGAGGLMANMRMRFLDLAEHIDERVPDSREKALSITNLEQALFWANKAIILADNEQDRLRSEGEDE